MLRYSRAYFKNIGGNVVARYYLSHCLCEHGLSEYRKILRVQKSASFLQLLIPPKFHFFVIFNSNSFV